MPLAAIVARSALDLGPEGALGRYTHEKSPLGAAAALATLDVIEQEGLVARARDMGRVTLKRLAALAGGSPILGKVRGLGMYWGQKSSLGPDVHRPKWPTTCFTPASSAALASRSGWQRGHSLPAPYRQFGRVGPCAGDLGVRGHRSDQTPERGLIARTPPFVPMRPSHVS